MLFAVRKFLFTEQIFNRLLPVPRHLNRIRQPDLVKSALDQEDIVLPIFYQQNYAKLRHKALQSTYYATLLWSGGYGVLHGSTFPATGIAVFSSQFSAKALLS